MVQIYNVILIQVSRRRVPPPNLSSLNGHTSGRHWKNWYTKRSNTNGKKLIKICAVLKKKILLMFGSLGEPTIRPSIPRIACLDANSLIRLNVSTSPRTGKPEKMGPSRWQPRTGGEIPDRSNGDDDDDVVACGRPRSEASRAVWRTLRSSVNHILRSS